ncbi:hypothetical protein M2101_000580 [Parabacteroides sp. PM5-20]|nr:hypothetical protein [Parabacteroides sp. PM5-20]
MHSQSGMIATISRSGAVVARWAHNPKVVSSSLASATKPKESLFSDSFFLCPLIKSPRITEFCKPPIQGQYCCRWASAILLNTFDNIAEQHRQCCRCPSAIEFPRHKQNKITTLFKPLSDYSVITIQDQSILINIKSYRFLCIIL